MAWYVCLGPQREALASCSCDYVHLLQVFHDCAYSALCRNDIMDAIDNFLDDSIVLPPGDWDQDLLVPIMQERNQVRRRKGEYLYNAAG